MNEVTASSVFKAPTFAVERVQGAPLNSLRKTKAVIVKHAMFGDVTLAKVMLYDCNVKEFNIMERPRIKTQHDMTERKRDSKYKEKSTCM